MNKEDLNAKWDIKNMIEESVKKSHNTPSQETLKMFSDIREKLGGLPCKEQAQRIGYFEKDIEEHKRLNNTTMSEFNKKLDNLADKVEKVDNKVQKIDTDISWLKRFFWIVATSSIGALVVSLFQLLSEKR